MVGGALTFACLGGGGDCGFIEGKGGGAVADAGLALAGTNAVDASPILPSGNFISP